jgi:FtsH-binding integral membrane protein
MKDLRHFTTDNNKSSKIISRNESKTFLTNVFLYMFAALAVSGIISWIFADNISLFSKMYDLNTGGLTTLGYIVMFAPVGLALLIQTAYNKFSVPALLLLFLLYAFLIGMSLCGIFHIYTSESIFSTFLITSVTYGVMAFLGYTTKLDLSKFGSIMYMLFIGLFIAALVNFFLNSEPLGYIISGIGIVVFTGLTAYKMQQFKQISEDPELSAMSKTKLSIIGGLQMYILFINLFVSLLRFFGSRD